MPAMYNVAARLINSRAYPINNVLTQSRYVILFIKSCSGNNAGMIRHPPRNVQIITRQNIYLINDRERFNKSFWHMEHKFQWN